MAKLCRIHLAGLGQDVARFNPLTIDLTNQKREPQDSVVWLRNGGGKTTLISLLYSIFVPRVSDFLGMRTHKNAKLEDFVRPNDIGVVATEWLFSGSTSRRIVGQIAVLTARELKRTFFSFSETATFSFDSLPVTGLATPAGSMDRIIDALKDAMASNPAMELVVVHNNQTEWIRHLDQLGLDSELFKTHIVMNSQEGGAADIFKIKAAEDFVLKFLELAYDQSASVELEKSLVLFQQKRLNAPHYRAAITYGESLCRLLAVFVQDLEKKGRFQKESDDLAIEMASMLTAISAHLADLNQRAEGLAKECEFIKDSEKEKDTERRRLRNTSKGFNRYGKKLRVQEATAEHQRAEDTRSECQQRVNVIRAAKCLLEVRRREAQQKALIEQQDRVQAEVKPILDALKVIGSRLVAAWNFRISELQAAHQLTEGELKTAKAGIKTIEGAITQAEVDRAEAAKDRITAETAIRNFEEARRHLQSTGALLDGEACEDATRRILNAIDAHNEALRKLAEREAVLKNENLATKASQKDVDTRCQQHRADVREAEGIITREGTTRQQVLLLPILRDISEGETLDLHNAHLHTQVESYRDSAHAEVVTLGVKDAEDKRDALSLDKSGLLAPSTDVDVVMSRLKSLGISSLPAYHWLAEHHVAAGAMKQLQRHPLALSGIIIQNEQDYLRAQTEVDSADIRSPVALIRAPKSDDSQGGTEFSIIIPSRLGLFSKDEAVRDRSELDGRREQRTIETENYQKVYERAGEALIKIQAFTSEFSTGRMKQVHEELAASRELLHQAEAEADQISRDLSEQELEKEYLGNQKSRIQAESQKAQGHQQTLISFYRDHDQKIEGNRKTASLARQKEESAKLSLVDLRSKQGELEQSERRLNEKATSQHSDLNLARKEKDRLPQQYIGEPLLQSDERPEEVSPIFDAQVQEYEGKAQLGEIEGLLKSCGIELGKANQLYNQAAANLPVPDVQAAATSAQIDQDLSDSDSALDLAKGNLVILEGDLRTAKREATSDAAEFKTGDLQLEPNEMPATSADAFAREKACDQDIERLSVEIDSSKERHQELLGKQSELKTESARYEGMAKRYENLSPATTSESRFVGVYSKDDETTEDLVRRRRRVVSDLNTVEKKLGDKYDTEIAPLTANPDLDKYRIPFRETLKRRSRADFDANAAVYLPDIQQQIAVYQNELASEEQELKIIVGQLDAIARRTTSLLVQTESASRMPEGLGAWAGHSFLRISVPKKNDEAERSTLLGQALETWYAREKIPTGHELAFACVYAVCGAKSIIVKLLKPEYHLSPVQHEITDLVKFSDGEKLTAAILLYCVLIRLRARQRAKSVTPGTDAGMLLLDNPFGKATLPQFVDLQVKMARINGVQLIYATGVNDLGALKSFGHIVRLRNTSRNRASGDYHVTPDLAERSVEGVTLGVDLSNGNAHSENGNGAEARVDSQNRI